VSYTVEDLDEAIGELISWEGLFYKLFFGDKRYSLPSFGTLSGVEEYGGEGQGEDYWFIFKVLGPQGNVRFFKRDGWYASYDGGYYDGPTFEVKPVEKLVTVYEKV
jgi:hypothetical protein